MPTELGNVVRWLSSILVSYLKVIGHGTASSISQLTRGIVAHPSMDTSTTGIKPCHMFKTKIIFQSLIQYFDCHTDKCPTCVTNVRTGTSTVSDIVVIGQINVKHQFTLQWNKSTRLDGHRFVIFGTMRKDGTQINFGRTPLNDSIAQFGC